MVINTNKQTISEAIKKIGKLNSKSGPFDAFIILGDVSEEISKISVDGLSNIFTMKSSDIPFSGSKILTNQVVILNGCGVYQMSNKLKIAYISYNRQELAQYKDAIIDRFKDMDDPVDILISEKWSTAISDELNDITDGSDVIDEVTKLVQPKYTFSGSKKDDFVEFGPFSWDGYNRLSRFINVAELGLARWAYAMSLSTDSDEPLNNKTVLVNNPYTSRKRNLKDLDEPVTNSEDSKSKKVKRILPENCNFCFVNPSIEDHLIVSIGKHAYVTVAKGPLSVPKGDMPFAGHVLLIPVEHIPKSNMNVEKDTAMLKEMHDYEESIVNMNFRKFDMCTVVFEINSDRSVHFHKQIVPIPKYLILKFLTSLDRQVHFNNDKVSKNTKLEFKEYDSAEDAEFLTMRNDPKSNYIQFTVYEIPNKPAKVYTAQFEANDRIDLQFGRRVLAFLLRLPKRIKWDSPACVQTQEQEIKETKAFQKSYKEFDIAK